MEFVNSVNLCVCGQGGEMTLVAGLDSSTKTNMSRNKHGLQVSSELLIANWRTEGESEGEL